MKVIVQWVDSYTRAYQYHVGCQSAREMQGKRDMLPAQGCEGHLEVGS